MVGEPKTLSDLGRMDAHLSVRCRGCGRRRVYDRGLLRAELMARRVNLTWSELPRALACACGSTDLRLAPIAFARSGGSVVDPEMRPYQRVMVRLAVDVLGRGAGRPSIEVRLALHVLRPWVTADLLLRYWRSPGACEAHAAIARELRMMGRLDPEQAANDRG